MFFCLSFIFCSIFGQEISNNNNFIPIKDDFTQSGITSINKDSDGFVWITTYGDGLFRYNGINFKKYALKTPVVHTTFQDSQGNIWIGTNGGGVFVYNLQSKKLKRLSESFPQISKQINGYITDIEIDRNGRFWLGSNGSGVAILDTATGKIEVRNNSNSNVRSPNSLVHEDRMNQQKIHF